MPQFPKGSFSQAGVARGGAGKQMQAGKARGKSSGSTGQAKTARGSANLGHDKKVSSTSKDKPSNTSGMQGSASE